MPPWMKPTRKPQLAQPLDEIVERVLELGEDQQALVGMVEEALGLEQLLEPRELGLGTRVLDCLGLLRPARAAPRSPRAPVRRSRARVTASSDLLEPLALVLLHLLEFVGIGKIGRCRRGPVPGRA